MDFLQYHKNQLVFVLKFWILCHRKTTMKLLSNIDFIFFFNGLVKYIFQMWGKGDTSQDVCAVQVENIAF